MLGGKNIQKNKKVQKKRKWKIYNLVTKSNEKVTNEEMGEGEKEEVEKDVKKDAENKILNGNWKLDVLELRKREILFWTQRRV